MQGQRLAPTGKEFRLKKANRTAFFQEHRGGRHYSDEKKADFEALFQSHLAGSEGFFFFWSIKV